MAGEHVMHHTDGLWNSIWSDLFIESTYMRYGHGPSLIGATLSKTTLAVSALSQNTMGQMANYVAELDNHQEHVVLRKKEERPIHINDNSRDRQSIREAIASCIDFFAVLDIVTGRIIDDLQSTTVNVLNAVGIGTSQMRAYESNWPDGFHTA